MRRMVLAVVAVLIFSGVSYSQTLGGTHQETGIVQGAFSGGIFNFYIQHPYDPNCGLSSVTLYLNIGDPSRPIPVDCGPVYACQCWGFQAGTVVSVSGRVVGNGASPGDTCLAALLHVASISVVKRSFE